MRTTFKFFLVCTVCAVVGPLHAVAQNATEALRYSQSNLIGSARSMSVGGAFGAVGSDYSSSSINPAGLGLFRKSEITGSFSIFNSTINSTYLQNETEDARQSNSIPNLGLVISNIKRSKGKALTTGWVNTTFALGFNRTNNFNASSYYQGVNNRSTILDYYAQEANGQTQDALYENTHTIEGLAWRNFLINPSDGQNRYARMFSDTSFSIQQSNFKSGTGRTSDWNMSYAANYSNRFYVGGTLTYSRLTYNEDVSYEEKDLNNSVDSFSSMTVRNYLRTAGGGVNLKIGAILRPADFIRFGLSYQSPTVYSLRDDYGMDLNAVYDLNINNKSAHFYSSEPGYYDYKITTPSRVTGSVALIFSDKGFFSVDYEMVDYSKSKLNASDYAFADENSNIRKQYRNAGNLRLGGEWKYDIFSFRAGYGFSGSPFKYADEIAGNKGTRNTLSFGVGLREKSFFLDLAFVNSWQKDFSTPYTLNKPQVTNSAANSIHHNNVLITTGLRF
jgi:hypothetical protein